MRKEGGLVCMAVQQHDATAHVQQKQLHKDSVLLNQTAPASAAAARPEQVLWREGRRGDKEREQQSDSQKDGQQV